MEQNNYINYNNNQIDLNAFMEYAASGIDSYLKRKSWTNKRKLLFLDAYQDIMSRGVLGASPEDGLWKVSHKGDQIDLNSMSKKQQEMYKEAAYYIKKSMEEVYSPKEESSKDKETSTKSTYSALEHINNFNRFLSNNMFGGNSINIEDWNNLDVISSDGNRETTKRAAKLADLLQSYSDSLKDDYDFTDSPYSDINDLKTRIGEAITLLKNGTWDREDKNALNRIGLDWRNYFDTSGLKADNQQQGTAQSSEEPVISSNQDVTPGKLRRLKGVHAREASSSPDDYNATLADAFGVGEEGFNKFNEQLLLLLEKGSVSALTGEESKNLGNLIHFIRLNNPNYQKSNITDSDWNELSKSPYKKLLQDAKKEDFIRLPYRTSNSQYVYADKQGNVYYLTTKGNKELSPIKFEKSDKYNKYKSNFLKTKVQINNSLPVLSLDKDILISDMTSMLGDIVSLGGGYAGAAGGITSLISDLYGDIRRGKDTWSTIKNLGANIAWGVAGLIPGAKLAKLGRNAARIYATLQSAGILMNDEVRLSWKNLIAGKSITARDFENFKWTLHAITGGTNAIRGHYTEKNIDKKINNKPTIETKSGKKVSLTKDLVKLINKVGGRKGQKAAEEAFKKATGEEAKEGTFEFLENSRAWYNPNRYSQRLRNWTSDNERLVLPKNQSINTLEINRLLEIDRAKPIFAPFSRSFWTTPKLRKSGNPFNKRFWNEGGPNRGGLTFALTPYRTNNVNVSASQNENIKTSRNLLIINNSKNKLITNNPRLEYMRKQQQKAQKEIDLFTKSYRERGKSGLESFLGGYGSNKIKPGTYTFDLGNGNKVTFEVPKNESLASVRNRIQNQIKEMVLGKTDVVTSANILRRLKKVGALKQGGNINTIIYNFLKEKQ